MLLPVLFGLLLITASLSAFGFGGLVVKFGYRKLLGGACFFGVLSSVVGFSSSLNQSLPLLLGSFLLTGIAQGLLPMSRYIAAEVTESAKKYRAMGFVIFGAAIGSTIGPVGMNAAGSFSEKLGFSLYNGIWVLEGFLFLGAFLILLFGLKVNPKEVAEAVRIKEGRSLASSLQNKTRVNFPFQVWYVIGVMVFSQVAMVLVMSITPIHMQHGGHSMGAVTWTISAHMFGMFGLSYPIGWMSDKLGTRLTILSGVLVLLFACLITFVSHSMPVMLAGLFLLGLGWSACFVAGSRMLSEVAPEGMASRVQGFNEAIMLIVSGVTVFTSGFLFAELGFAFMCGLGALASALTGLCLVLSHKQ